MPRIPFETQAFPNGTVANGVRELDVSWDDILWAAVTVGRPNRQYVFAHGAASMYEAVFRWSLVRMSIEQSGPAGYRLRRTAAARTLDPTEKGAVNYFLGMVGCKLFSAKLLNAPWLLHLDVFRPMIDPVLTGRSRPDLVGLEEGTTDRWHAFECKGRISPPDRTAKINAKAQAQSLVAVNGTACLLHIGAITYFRGDVLNFFWCDPPPKIGHTIEVPFSEDNWRHYYQPIVHLIQGRGGDLPRADPGVLLPIPESDIEVGVHPIVAKYLLDGQWAHARTAAAEAQEELTSAHYQVDGIKIVAGPSWSQKFAEPDMS